jgi:hypothetical protein
MRRSHQNSTNSERSSDLEDEKKSSEFYEFRPVHQDREDEKKSSEFYEFRPVHQDQEDEKKSSEFYERKLNLTQEKKNRLFFPHGPCQCEEQRCACKDGFKPG